MFVGVDVLGDPQYTNSGRDIVFSADLCYNGVGDNNGWIKKEKNTKISKF